MPGPRFGLEGTSSPDEQYARDLDRAAGFKPITQEDLKTAYGQYDQKVGQVKGGNSDKQLYQRAVTTVIAWWKKQKSAEAAKKATPAPTPSPKPGSSGGGSGGGSGSSGGSYSGGSSSAGSASRGQMLPDTAMPLGKGPTLPKLKPIPQPITANLVATQLKLNGLTGAKPPAYALKNKDTFLAWVRRAVAQRKAKAGQSVAVRNPQTGRTVVTTNKPVASNRRPVIR